MTATALSFLGRRRSLVILLAVVAVSLTSVVSVLTLHAASQRTKAASLPGDSVPLLQGVHIASVASRHEPYNSVPPTSGPHVPWTVAPGVYRESIPEELQVHALEHGHVLIQYSPGTTQEEISTLQKVARLYPRDVIVAPYPKLRTGLALTAWGRISKMDHADIREVIAFVGAWAGKYNHGPQP